MHIENIHESMECLSKYAKEMIAQGAGSGKVDIKCAGEIIDMVKDLAEAEYYAKISKAMDKSEEEKEDEEKYMLQRMKEEYGEDNGERYYNDWRYANGRYAPKGRGTRRGYNEPITYRRDMYPAELYRDMDRSAGRMYYPENVRYDESHVSHMDGDTRTYSDGYSDGERNERNRLSRSERARRGYQESQATHSNATQDGKEKRMRELNTYMDELADDMKSLVGNMSAEERTMLKSKMAKLNALV